jgi:Raf kinase inhibitor-like YbhB/YbcL family protein
MEIKSRAFNNEGKIPPRYTCDGENTNPPLEIIDIPDRAKFLALVIDDPDAPNKTWVHWLIWNIPVEGPNLSIEENGPPEDATYGTNDFDKLKYGGPCPPSGTHRYFFKVYALDSELDLKEGSTKEELMEEVNQRMIESAELIGLYSRRK